MLTGAPIAVVILRQQNYRKGERGSREMESSLEFQT